MSIFVRPASPPPRQPSPDVLPAPLPYPRHPRRVPSQPKIRVHSPALPPGLNARTKPLHSARSYDFMSTRETKFSDDGHASPHSPRPRTLSTLNASPASTPSSSPAPSSRNSPDFTSRHRRTLSVALPYSSSPSPSPTVESEAPPVPPLPYRYTGPQHIVCPKPMSLTSVATPILLSDIEAARHTAPVPTMPPILEPKGFEQKYTLPALEKHKSMGIACLKFFGLRSPTRQPRTAVAAL
ncbi:hypothetical protein GALMADRAFT_133048 [Galerina marginata CBS 339.88]|uniref:Uncharacterized protein n=1 Tax=Galerina marginata (strain CBS 339.88) TaxID=685588 RepID=A0A067TUM8_GALM3|nr:hypothetical protein GALMADRAFT_133048 [Galerina marginata CBS 339.88]